MPVTETALTRLHNGPDDRAGLSLIFRAWNGIATQLPLLGEG